MPPLLGGASVEHFKKCCGVLSPASGLRNAHLPTRALRPSLLTNGNVLEACCGSAAGELTASLESWVCALW